jgi:hypothetical protein
MVVAPASLLRVSLIGLALVTASCGKGTEDKVGFLQWYMREFRKGLAEQRAREAENAMYADRDARFWDWAKSPEGKKAISDRTEVVLTAETGFPDTVYEMSPGTEFKISSRSARATLTGKIDGRDGFALATLLKSDGSYRSWRQGMASEKLGDLGERFDDDDRLAAALLKSNPRPAWTGRAVTRTRRDAQTIARQMWQERTGEKLRFH